MDFINRSNVQQQKYKRPKQNLKVNRSSDSIDTISPWKVPYSSKEQAISSLTRQQQQQQQQTANHLRSYSLSQSPIFRSPKHQRSKSLSDDTKIKCIKRKALIYKQNTKDITFINYTLQNDERVNQLPLINKTKSQVDVPINIPIHDPQFNGNNNQLAYTYKPNNPKSQSQYFDPSKIVSSVNSASSHANDASLEFKKIINQRDGKPIIMMQRPSNASSTPNLYKYKHMNQRTKSVSSIPSRRSPIRNKSPNHKRYTSITKKNEMAETFLEENQITSNYFENILSNSIEFPTLDSLLKNSTTPTPTTTTTATTTTLSSVSSAPIRDAHSTLRDTDSTYINTTIEDSTEPITYPEFDFENPNSFFIEQSKNIDFNDLDSINLSFNNNQNPTGGGFNITNNDNNNSCLNQNYMNCDSDATIRNTSTSPEQQQYFQQLQFSTPAYISQQQQQPQLYKNHTPTQEQQDQFSLNISPRTADPAYQNNNIAF